MLKLTYSPLRKTISGLFLILFAASAMTAQPPKRWTSGDIHQAIQKLNFLGSALYVAAHPDDENTRLISYLSNGVKAETAYLSMTRGDGGQNLMKRTVGGTATYELFMQIASQSSGRVVWVVAFSRYAWRHLECRFKTRTLFNRVLAIGNWSEDEIGQLIDQRMKASGYVADYRDLIMDPVEGSALELETTRTAERFRRLLWDYADGNPRVAIHFWLRSLVPAAGNHMRVRLFPRPDEDRLLKLGEEARFTLAATAIHENVSIEELAETLAYPLELCKSVVTYLVNDELLELRHGRFVLTTDNYRAVIRYLRRNNLLHV